MDQPISARTLGSVQFQAFLSTLLKPHLVSSICMRAGRGSQRLPPGARDRGSWLASGTAGRPPSSTLLLGRETMIVRGTGHCSCSCLSARALDVKWLDHLGLNTTFNGVRRHGRSRSRGPCSLLVPRWNGEAKLDKRQRAPRHGPCRVFKVSLDAQPVSYARQTPARRRSSGTSSCSG